MEVYNGTRCITREELMEVCCYAGTINTLVGRGKLSCVRRGCRNTPALYDVDSLPYKYRCEVYKRMPDLNAQAEAKPFIDTIEPDGEAINFYEGYTFSDGSHLAAEKVREYMNNAAVLNAFRTWLDRSNGMRAKTGHRSVPKGEFWAKAAGALPRIADRYPHTLPENPRRLQQKYNEYLKGGYPSLISGKHGNSNAAKVLTEEQRNVLCGLRACPNGFDDVFIAARYNEIALKSGWKTITPSAVEYACREKGLAIEAARNGTTAFMNSKAMQVARSRPTAAMLMWSLDGWDAEFYYQKRNAKGVVTYTNRKVLEVVLDPCCDYPIGFAIGDVENAALIQEALRNALNHTRELFGRRYRTCQIQSDHFAESATAPYYATAADKVIMARVRNAKSKPVERYFLHLNDTYGPWFRNWSGHGVKSKKQPSAEYKNLVKHDFPEEDELVRMLEAVMTAERKEHLEEYMKFWESTPEERRLPLSDEAFLLRFGKTTGYTNVLEGSGLRPRIEGRKMQYDCFDIRFRELAYLRWEVRYDTSDLSRVLAVSGDGKHRFLLEEKYVQPMALADRKEGDGEQLARIGRHNDFLLEYARNSSREMFETLAARTSSLISVSRKEGVLENPDEHVAEAKALITDSRGQHKSRRAAGRRRLVEDAEFEDVTDAKKAEPVPVVVENPPAGEQRVSTFDLY